jgi:hypothetical protein
LINAFIASFFHGGGIVGAPGSGTRRMISQAAFAFAPRYHSGGIAGLRRNEVPAVLEEGEEVLTTDSPRHRNNYKGSGGGINTTVNVSVSSDGQQDRATAERYGNELGRAVERTCSDFITAQLRPGGMLAAR